MYRLGTAMVVLYLSLLLTTSCTRPADGPNNPNPQVTIQDSTLLRQFIAINYAFHPDTVFAETYIYDANKRLITVFTRSQVPGGSGGPVSIGKDTLTYYYNGNDTLAQMAVYKTRRYDPSDHQIGEEIYTFKYGYDNTGKIIADTMTVDNLTNVNRYVYVSNTQVTQFEKTLFAGGGSSGEFQYTITLGWQGSNLASEIHGSTNITYQINYDDKVFPFRMIRPVYSFIPSIQPFTMNTFWSLRASKNNTRQTNRTTYATGVPLTTTLNYTYLYRSDGYPTRVTQSPIPFQGWSFAVFLYY